MASGTRGANPRQDAFDTGKLVESTWKAFTGGAGGVTKFQRSKKSAAAGGKGKQPASKSPAATRRVIHVSESHTGSEDDCREAAVKELERYMCPLSPDDEPATRSYYRRRRRGRPATTGEATNVRVCPSLECRREGDFPMRLSERAHTHAFHHSFCTIF